MSRKQILGYNEKMKKTEAEHPELMFRCFSLPACATCCPNAGKCKEGCYAKKGRMACPTAQNAYYENYDMVVDGSLWKQLDAEITVLECKAEREHKQLRIRVHDSGDFFSVEYTNHWMDVMRNHPDVVFYAYTKMVNMFKYGSSIKMADNFHYVLSYGGLEDENIQDYDRKAIVISEDMDVPQGYVDGSHDDYYASEPSYEKIALYYHGPKSGRFTAY